MASVWRASSRVLSRLPACQSGLPLVRCVSTTKGSKDLIDESVTTGPIQEPHRITLTPEAKEKLRGQVKTDQWQSFGFDIHDEATDRLEMHKLFFITVSLGLVLGSFVWAYMPDRRLLDWAHREAYLQIQERESSGRPLLDRNLVDPAQITLPSDDELGDTRIII